MCYVHLPPIFAIHFGGKGVFAKLFLPLVFFTKGGSALVYAKTKVLLECQNFSYLSIINKPVG